MQKPPAGVILVNLGTPAEPTPASVRQFLREFLSDPRVVDVPPWLWKPLLNIVILPRRAPRVARSYQRIWLDQGSPLRHYTQELAAKVNQYFAESAIGPGSHASVVVTWAMTYGEPSVSQRLEECKQRGVKNVVLCPLYPQFSSTTTGSVYDCLAKYASVTRDIPDFRCVHNYHDHPDYIESLANSVERHWQTHGRGQKLLISFHGLPERYVEQGDPYIDQCRITARLLAEKLQLESNHWQTGFQSRFGRAKWVEPYADAIINDWASHNIKTIDVICPSFATDCLETLEEIGVEYKAMFQQAGGDRLALIPCLNSSRDHVELLTTIVKEYL